MSDFCNLHKHSHYSNITLPDSVVTNEDYCKRAVELGQKAVFSTEHGHAGNYRELSDLSKKYGLRWRYAAEAYFVKDRFSQDKTNAHMILAARTEKGMYDLNETISGANIEGYYYRPRVDLDLLMKLDPKDVFVTTACVAGVWGYGWDKEAQKYDWTEPDRLVHVLRDHFKDSFMLEVQNHDVDRQKAVNEHILKLYRQEGIPLICGLDSHYIHPEQAKLRDDFLASKHLVYAEEEGWYMDYPDEEEVYRRFKAQGVLSDALIAEAMNNTAVALDWEDIEFDKSRKLPTLYPNLAQEERNEKYRQLIRDKWREYRVNVPKERWPEYLEGIKYEVDTITKTNTSDYFLLDYEIVKRFKEKGGQLTKSGRGCFTENARITTLNGLKKISDVCVGDMVIDRDGVYRLVEKTFAYEIEEPLIEIQATHNKMFGEYPRCTVDHKILVKRNDEYIWVAAKNLVKGDRLCVPKYTYKDNDVDEDKRIDLAAYAWPKYEITDTTIIETAIDTQNNAFSTTALAKKYGVSKSAIGNFLSGRTPMNNVKSGKRIYAVKEQLLQDFGCASQEELTAKYKQAVTQHVSRYLVKDELFYEFIGMMYGDGWCSTKTNQSVSIGLAINPNNHKNERNRYVFTEMAKRIGATIFERRSKNRHLIQLYCKSSTFGRFLMSAYFESSRGNKKELAEELLHLSPRKSLAVWRGLMNSDGNRTQRDRMCFDNTSPSIINGFRILALRANIIPPRLQVRNAWHDQRGYDCDTSYKWTFPVYLTDGGMSRKISDDDKYWLIPVTGIKTIPPQKTIVYDLQVEQSHSFLLNNMIVHNSSPSFFTNNLLGFTSIDRFNLPVPILPDRFISEDRAKTGLPDIDMNCGNPEVFAEAQAEVMGEWHSAPMVAYGTLKRLSAWKMYCRAANVEFEVANKISDNLKQYELAYKHADDDEREEINAYDYVPEEYHHILKQSEAYLGMIESISPHPCAYLLTNKDIRREVGIFRINAKVGQKKTVYAAFIDGATADGFGYLKNDDLAVTVVKLNANIYKRIGMPQPDVPQLLEMTKGDKATWDLYAKGYTLALNQVEKEKSTEKVMRYKPKNITELSAFVAAIRPGFQSLVDRFLSRQHFTYGIPVLDKMLQNQYMTSSWLLYQENAMEAFQYAGFSGAESYAAIKAIAKKKAEKVLVMKERFLDGFSTKLLQDDPSIKDVQKTANEVWGIIEDATSYSFNGSHSVSVALDSLYTAWAKAHYPLETYTAMMESYAEKGDKDRIDRARQEMKQAFGITVVPPKFRQDNRDYFLDHEHKTISDSLVSIKNVSKTAANALYHLGQRHYDSFVDLLYEMTMDRGLNARVIEILIRLDYFSEFGRTGKLLAVWREFTNGEAKFSKSHIKATQLRHLDELRRIEKEMPDTDIPTVERASFEISVLGTPVTVDKEAKGLFAVVDLDTKYSPKATLYNIAAGTTGKMKIRKPVFNTTQFDVGDVIRIDAWEKKQAMKFVDGKAKPNAGVYDLWLKSYGVVYSQKIKE